MKMMHYISQFFILKQNKLMKSVFFDILCFRTFLSRLSSYFDYGERKKVDLYRDTPVRYLGYANEVGEAFRSIIGRKWVNFTYGVASLYVLADTTHKSSESYEVNKNEKNHLKKVIYTTTDTLVWQFLASVIIPGVTINRVCAISNFMLKKSEKLPKNSRKWTVTAIGLITIPFIIKPIDELVDEMLDLSLRKYAPE